MQYLINQMIKLYIVNLTYEAQEVKTTLEMMGCRDKVVSVMDTLLDNK